MKQSEPVGARGMGQRMGGWGRVAKEGFTKEVAGLIRRGKPSERSRGGGGGGVSELLPEMMQHRYEVEATHKLLERLLPHLRVSPSL